MIGTTQREILEALIELYGKKKTTIRGDEIANLLERTTGTIRNQMQTLKALGYVDGVPGPRGGYIPSMRAYEAIGIQSIEKPRLVYIYRDGNKIEDLFVQKMIFTQIAHPTECKALITVLGDTRRVRDGDIIRVGPTPVNHIVLRGKVVGRDDSRREVMVSLYSVTSIPKGKVEDVATKELISFVSDTQIRDCAKLLMKKRINAAPVIDDGKLTGIITVAEMVRAVAEGKTGNTVGEIAVKNPFTIDKNAQLIKCIEKMRKYDVGRLIVMDDEKAVGIITRTDILLRMLD